MVISFLRCNGMYEKFMISLALMNLAAKHLSVLVICSCQSVSQYSLPMRNVALQPERSKSPSLLLLEDSCDSGVLSTDDTISLLPCDSYPRFRTRTCVVSIIYFRCAHCDSTTEAVLLHMDCHSSTCLLYFVD
jgi:hypothetical protein